MNDLRALVSNSLAEIQKRNPGLAVSADPIKEAGKDSATTAGTLSIRTLAMPNSLRRMHNDIFGDYKIQRGELTPDFFEGEEMFKCVKNSRGASVAYYLAKDVVENKIPSLPYMALAYKVSLSMGFEQGSHKISFTLGDKAEKMGYSKDRIAGGGKIFEQIDRTERALAGTIIHHKTKDLAGKDIEYIGALCSMKKQGSGKGATYEVTINTDFTTGMNFETGIVETPYTKDPLMLMTNRLMPRAEKNLRTAFNALIGLQKFHPYGETLLEFARMSKRDSRRKALRKKTFDLALKILKEMGFKFVSVDHKGSKDFRKWQFHFKPPSAKKAKQSEFTFINSAEAQKLIAEFVAWQCKDAHYGKAGATLTDDKIRDQITNTIRGYGFEKVKGLFEAVNRTTDPSPKHFWNEIKALKRRKNQ